MFERGVTTVALWSGPLVALGYLLGSLPFLRSLAVGLRSRTDRHESDRPSESVLPAISEALLAVLAAHVAWQVISSLAPGGATVNPFDDVSPIAVFSAQALTAWQSVALWAGFAAVLGNVAPVWTRFRGGTGIPPAIGLTVVYLPTVFGAGVVGFFAGLALTRERRPAIVAAVVAALAFAWLAWVNDWRPGWGMRSGAEPTIWVLMTGLLLAARNVVEPGEGGLWPSTRPDPEA